MRPIVELVWTGVSDRTSRPRGIPTLHVATIPLLKHSNSAFRAQVDASLPESLFVTEHHLQVELTRLWAREGIPGGPSDRIMLLGWEVMLPSWRINDARLQWSEPSVDFIGIDRFGHLVLVESKVNLRGVKPVLDAAAQLTAAALLCERSAKQDGVLAMLAALSRGHNDRGIPVREPRGVTEVFETHQRFFNLQRPLLCIASGTQRVLAVRQPGRGVADKVLRLRTPEVAVDLDQFYAAYSHSRMYARLAKLLPVSDGELSGPIRFIEV